jgi:23S rRNA-/tRNA-specific pseudouridylate synthase
VNLPRKRTITADRGDDRERLDRVLLRHLADLPEATRTKIQACIRNGFVTVNGKRPGRSSEKVKTGEKIEVQLPAPPPARSAPVAQDIPLSSSKILIFSSWTSPPASSSTPRSATGTERS